MAQLEVEIVNKVTNIGALAEEKAALSAAMGGGFAPLGGGTVNFGGSLTKEEQAVAAAQLSTLEKTKTGLRDVAGAANLAGGEMAGLTNKASALTSLGLTPMTVGLVAAAVGMGLVFEAGKSMLDNADKQETATRDLAQAYGTLGEKVPTDVIARFIDQNKRFIPSMYDVEEGFAAMARAGFNDTEQMKLMNLALDLSAAKHIDLTTAETALIDAEHGRMLGLISLGISAKEINEIEGKNATQAEKNALLEELLTKKLDGARKSTSDLKQSQDELRVTWEKMSNDNGPALESMLSAVISKTDDFLNLLRSSDWGGFNNVLVTIASSIHSVASAIGEANTQLNNFISTSGTQNGPAGGGRQPAYAVRRPAARARGFILGSN